MLIDTILMDKKINVQIWKIDSPLEEEMYLSEFEYEERRYVISGAISYEEMKKIIKNTIFL